MKRVAIYARVSTSDGKQDYSRQINELTELAKSQGSTEIVVFSEMVSGYKKSTDRPELNRMLTTIEADPTVFSMIYTAEISRIGRNPSETRKIIDRLTDLKIPVYIQSLNQATIDSNGNRNMMMNIILQVLMEYANLESETFKTRSKSGLLQAVKMGRVGGSDNLPYGYKNVDKQLVVDEDEAEVIRLIFELYRSGKGVKVIANTLNEKGIKTRTNISKGDRIMNYKIPKLASATKWSDAQILSVITNPLYCGQRRFKGNIYPAPYIITEELFTECTKIRENKNTRNITTKYTYLLKDIIKCGKCGRNYFGKFKPQLNKDKVYICSSRLVKGGGCGNKGINISFIESFLYQEISSGEKILEFLKDVENIKQSIIEDITEIRASIASAESGLKEKDNEFKRLMDIYLKGAVPEQIYIERNNSITSDKESLTAKINLLQSELSDKESTLKSLDEEKPNADMLERVKGSRSELQKLFRKLIEKVVINEIDEVLARVTVYFKGSEAGATYYLDITGLFGNKKRYEYFYGYPTNDKQDSVGIIKKHPQYIFNTEDFIYSTPKQIRPENILRMA